MCHVAALPVPVVMEQSTYDFFVSRISSGRRERLRRLVRREDAYRSLLAEVLARAMIGKHLRLSDGDIHFVENAYGKPLLAGYETFHFNLSHSGCWVVMMWGEAAVGVDIEQIRDIDLGIARRFFSPLENEDLWSKPEAERKTYFYDLWTLKESYIKALGTGLSTPLHSFSIRKDRGAFILLPNRERCRFAQFPLDPAYKLSICSFGGMPPESVDVFPIQELVDIWAEIVHSRSND